MPKQTIRFVATAAESPSSVMMGLRDRPIIDIREIDLDFRRNQKLIVSIIRDQLDLPDVTQVTITKVVK